MTTPFTFTDKNGLNGKLRFITLNGLSWRDATPDDITRALEAKGYRLVSAAELDELWNELDHARQRLAQVAVLSHDRDGDSLEFRSKRLGECAEAVRFSTDRGTIGYVKIADELMRAKEQVEQLTARAPSTRWESNGEAGDHSELCSVCGAPVTSPHSAQQCFEEGQRLATMARGLDAEHERDEARAELERVKAERDDLIERHGEIVEGAFLDRDQLRAELEKQRAVVEAAKELRAVVDDEHLIGCIPGRRTALYAAVDALASAGSEQKLSGKEHTNATKKLLGRARAMGALGTQSGTSAARSEVSAEVVGVLPRDGGARRQAVSSDAGDGQASRDDGEDAAAAASDHSSSVIVDSKSINDGESESGIDPRPFCIQCGERWAPEEGVDATAVPCRECWPVESPPYPAPAIEEPRCHCGARATVEIKYLESRWLPYCDKHLGVVKRHAAYARSGPFYDPYVQVTDERPIAAAPATEEPAPKQGEAPLWDSPLPWRLDGTGTVPGGKAHRLVDARGAIVAHIPFEQDAEFILVRCNAPAGVPVERVEALVAKWRSVHYTLRSAEFPRDAANELEELLLRAALVGR